MRNRSRVIVLGLVMALVLALGVVAAAANGSPKWKEYGGAFNVDKESTFVSSIVDSPPNTPSRVIVDLSKSGKASMTITASCFVDGQTIGKTVTKNVKDGAVIKVKWPDGVEEGEFCGVNVFGSHFTSKEKKHRLEITVEMKKN